MKGNPEPPFQSGFIWRTTMNKEERVCNQTVKKVQKLEPGAKELFREWSSAPKTSSKKYESLYKEMFRRDFDDVGVEVKAKKVIVKFASHSYLFDLVITPNTFNLYGDN